MGHIDARTEQARARLQAAKDSGALQASLERLMAVKLTKFCPHCNKECEVDVLFHGEGQGALQCMECNGVI